MKPKLFDMTLLVIFAVALILMFLFVGEKPTTDSEKSYDDYWIDYTETTQSTTDAQNNSTPKIKKEHDFKTSPVVEAKNPKFQKLLYSSRKFKGKYFAYNLDLGYSTKRHNGSFSSYYTFAVIDRWTGVRSSGLFSPDSEQLNFVMGKNMGEFCRSNFNEKYVQAIKCYFKISSIHDSYSGAVSTAFVDRIEFTTSKGIVNFVIDKHGSRALTEQGKKLGYSEEDF